jgi:hypothetical protein
MDEVLSRALLRAGGFDSGHLEVIFERVIRPSMGQEEAAMALPFDQIKEEALNLDLDSRANLARELLRSLDDMSDAENERLWLDEAERRQTEIRAGRVAPVPGDEVMEQLNRVLG